MLEKIIKEHTKNNRLNNNKRKPSTVSACRIWQSMTNTKQKTTEASVLGKAKGGQHRPS